ncbi:BAG family molecular chaperone regulator 6 isoform X2 [Momordica charantia]|uniref:BAG family molecular chaperone regulator 6 isoform X2 n=1 Tax=Momordica charantia TaxID=3673 RepID=A0A6J1CZH4_MOMCH|nr:BAG family molecular chaperone regulator 6 isoform X2 [Momordica charantia]
MIPAYRYMDSHPFQKNQMPSNPYQYSNMEHIPSYMMMDPTRSYVPPTDSGRNTWYSGYPMPVYSCCNGGNFFPGCYGFRPPHHPVAPHQHMQCYGGYPSCPEPYYVPYVPPPHYNVEQPRFEFDKNMMMRNHHCCGCPNSLCGQNQNQNQNQNEGKCVRIEEEKPDFQRKGTLVPVQLGDNQCPILWIPPDYMGREKEREPSETETAKQEKERHGSNSTEKGLKFWSGWPLSGLSHLGSWLPDGEGMGVQNVQNEQQEDGKNELPFPVIWMPARKSFQNMDAPMKPTAEPSTIEGPEVLKTINQRNIPEKDMDHKTEDTKEIRERRCIPIPVATMKDNEEKESSRNNVKRQSSSSPKKSRLPPVCLRVDPLPKKKNSNGGSKSPSSLTPIAAKDNSESDSKIDNATAGHGSEKIIKTVEVRTHESHDQENEEIITSTGEQLSSPRQSEEKFLDKICKDGTEECTGKEDGREESTDKEDGRISHTDTSTKVVDEGLEVSSEDLAPDEGKKEQPNMTDIEAALLIQSAYRGYEVRKWELVKKMKQLVEIRQQIIEVQNRVKALELAPQDEKERMFTGEMIMRLLLKLDTIQEKLDCTTMTTKPTEAVQEVTTEKPAKQFDIETHDDRKEEEQDEADEVAIGEIFSEGANDSNSVLGESKEVQPLCGIDHMAGFESKEAQPLCGIDHMADFECAKSPVEAPDDRKEDEQDEVDVVAIGELFSEGVDESNNLLGESDEAQPLHKIHNMDCFEGALSFPADVNDENSKACEAEQVVELREPGVKNEDTSELSSQNCSKQLECEKVASSLFEDKKPEEAESTAEMEQNVEMVTDEILQIDMEGQTDDCQATISVPDENGQTEDHLAAGLEVPMREDDDPSNFEAAKLEHIETREVSDAEQNGEDSSHESKCENGNGAFDESQSNCTGDVNMKIELATADTEEKMVGEVQHQAKQPSEKSAETESETAYEEEKMVGEVQLQAKQPSEESAELQKELLNSYIHNEVISEKMAEEMDKRLVEENEKMKEMVEKLLEAGKEQIAIISKLSGRVKELEKRLAKKRKLRGGCGKSVSRQHPMLNGRIKT